MQWAHLGNFGLADPYATRAIMAYNITWLVDGDRRPWAMAIGPIALSYAHVLRVLPQFVPSLPCPIPRCTLISSRPSLQTLRNIHLFETFSCAPPLLIEV